MERVVFPEVNAGWGHVDEVGVPVNNKVAACAVALSSVHALR
jgi:hypothetical protein